MKVAFVFPGQGSQYPGMGKEIFSSPSGLELMERANSVLGFDLKGIILEGSEEELAKTEIAQPAIFLLSMALLEEIKKNGFFEPHFLAGHSLGEFSACACGGVFSFEEGLKIVHMRGKFMQEAVPEGKGAMCAVIGLESEKIVELLKGKDYGGVVEVANFNSPEQTVISGEKEAVMKAVDEFQKIGAKKCIFLKVSAPFHCSLMVPARDKLRDLLEIVEFHNSAIPIVSNVIASPVEEGYVIKNLLIRQVVEPVRWVDVVKCLFKNGVKKFVEIGPGRVLSGLIKRILKEDVKIISIEDLRGIENAVSSLS